MIVEGDFGQTVVHDAMANSPLAACRAYDSDAAERDFDYAQVSSGFVTRAGQKVAMVERIE